MFYLGDVNSLLFPGLPSGRFTYVFVQTPINMLKLFHAFKGPFYLINLILVTVTMLYLVKRMDREDGFLRLNPLNGRPLLE